MASDYRPIKFVDQLEGNNHIVLLYHDQKYADIVIARYLFNGLKKGESCIFFTADEPEDVRRRLSEAGIDVNLHIDQNGSLRIFPIESVDSNKIQNTLGTINRIIENATQGMKPPFRFVGRVITETETVQGMEMGMIVEKTGHEHFQEFNCSELCYYEISRIEPSKRDQWISQLLKTHHHVIYASEPEKAVAFETELLEEV